VEDVERGRAKLAVAVGRGRPGWHIECSAMNCKQLGNHFDIHGGGSDLMFPHHENEIAQSTCAHDGEYVNYWMHSGMVMVDREKMSKSLGNFFTVRDVLKYYDAETIRYFLMSGHYRSQLNYSEENLKQARSALERLYRAARYRQIRRAAGGEAFEARFIEAMDDDFNTPEAYSVLFDMAREVNRLKTEDAAAANAMAAHLRKLARCWGCWSRSRTPSCRAARRLTTRKWRKSNRLSSSVWTRVKRKTGRRRMRRVTVSTRWGSCWKMARRAPPGAGSKP
jgi:cysteinyl-tRNA synthetase